jgi:hypothetical protein
MNERIKELERQAVEYVNQQNTFDPRSEFSKKFAELIVRECADIGQQYADGNYEVYNQILEHFGVEEE